MTTRIKEIAKDVAINSKASGIDDFGCLYDDDWSLTDEEWSAVCDEAERLLPTVTVPASVRASWAQADRDIHAEARAERIAFSSHW